METPANPTPQKSKKRNSPLRIYRGADADMLIAGLVITDHALAHQAELVKRRSRLTTTFLTELRTDIAKALKEDIGLNPEASLLDATDQLNTAVRKVQSLLVDFYQDLRDGYATNKTRLHTISTALGFRDHYDAVRRNDQQAIGRLLTQFDQQMTAELLAELTDSTKGDISAQLIAEIRTHADFADLNVGQEGLKGINTEFTAAQVEKFNDLYRRYMSVARLGRSYYRHQPATADKFSFSHTRRQLRGGAISRPTTT